jgi:hypothetical protein
LLLSNINHPPSSSHRSPLFIAGLPRGIENYDIAYSGDNLVSRFSILVLSHLSGIQ